jgi:hypothetical protein
MRREASTKKTMGEAAAELGNTMEDDAVYTEGEHACTIMPHNEMTAEDLDNFYPTIIAPPDEGLDDPINDDNDDIYKHGLEIAAAIADDMTVHGRTRHDYNSHDHSRQPQLQHNEATASPPVGCVGGNG